MENAVMQAFVRWLDQATEAMLLARAGKIQKVVDLKLIRTEQNRSDLFMALLLIEQELLARQALPAARRQA